MVFITIASIYRETSKNRTILGGNTKSSYSVSCWEVFHGKCIFSSTKGNLGFVRIFLLENSLVQ